MSKYTKYERAKVNLLKELAQGNRPDNIPLETFKTWRKRYIKNQLTVDKIREILLKLGFEKVQKEIWEKDGRRVSP